MSRDEIYEKLTDIFEDVLDTSPVKLTDDTTAQDIEEWDSLSHITLITEIEEAFHMKFEMKDVVGMKNVGEMVTILEKAAK